MNDEATVRTRYPHATSRQFRGVFQQTPSRSVPEVWTIYRTESLGVHTLGTGSTEAEAWASAAAQVLAMPKGF